MTCAMTPLPGRVPQRGVSMIIALIVLTALGLIAAASLRAGATNLRTVDNTQARQRALHAAQAAIEATISSPAFMATPDLVAANPVDVDLDGDGDPDLSARITPAPACYRWQPIKVSELDPAQAADRPCLGTSAAANSGIEGVGAVTGESLCATSDWNVRAVVVDQATNADMRVNQGVQVRSLITDVASSCP